MAGMGRAPKPNARRPNRGLAGGALVRLPAAGRSGPAPVWPLGRPSRREAELWERIWRTPQAVAWERLDWADTVALYCRVQVQAERPKAPMMVLAEARQMQDRLGLSPMSLLRLRWEIVDEATEDAPEFRVVDIRERLKAVE